MSTDSVLCIHRGFPFSLAKQSSGTFWNGECLFPSKQYHLLVFTDGLVHQWRILPILGENRGTTWPYSSLLPRQSWQQEELHSPLHPLCQALGHPGSSLQSLRYGPAPVCTSTGWVAALPACCRAVGQSVPLSCRLQWCGLTEGDSGALGTLLATLPSLVHLELGDGALGDDGVRMLCAGLRQPGCQLRVLR